MVVLGLHCCAWAFSSGSEQELLLAVVLGLLVVVAPQAAERRLQVLGFQQLQRMGPAVVTHGLSCSEAFGISPEQGSNLYSLYWRKDS